MLISFETEKGNQIAVLIVIAIQDHKTKIEVGYGLEGTISDATAKRIIKEFMIPKFREGNYFQGISDGIDTIITKINEEELPKTNISQIAEEKFPVVEQKNDFDKYVAFVPYVISRNLCNSYPGSIGNRRLDYANRSLRIFFLSFNIPHQLLHWDFFHCIQANHG